MIANPIQSVAIAPQSDPENFQPVSLPLKLSTVENYLIQLKVDPRLLKDNTPYILKTSTEFGRYNISADPKYPKDILEPN
ncbi:MAG TPA: hypothetical protein ENK68_02480, partial [Epsilonproteobacteria bacterium]|nr:hypothetical protein [Campylobacterota bacterium]